MAEASEPVKLRTGRAAAIVGIAVMCSRLLGLIRETAFTALFGTTAMGYFITAFRLPNLLRDLFAEGALSTAFITIFTKKIATEGDQSAWRLAHKIGTLTLVVMGVITALGMIFSSSIVSIVAEKYTADQASLTTDLTSIMFPFILMVSLAAQVMGMLNAKHVFGPPAMASTFFNIGSIVGGLSLAWWMDGQFGERALYGLAYGTLIGGLLQLSVQFPALARAGYRPRLDFRWNDPDVGDVLRNMMPAVVAASAVQVNVLINTGFANDIGPSAVTWLNNAFRLMQLPLGLFGVAIGTVTLPLLSRAAALGNRDDFRIGLARGIRLVLFLTIPASAGLWLLGEPIISMIYGYKKVTWDDVQASAAALRWYAIGLAAYSGMKVLAPAFYAIGRRKTPMVISFFSIALNYLVNSELVKRGWGHEGLAMCTGIVALTNFGALYFFMHREISGIETRRLLVTLGKIFLATDALVLVCLGCDWLFLAKWQQMNFFIKAMALGLTIGLSVAAFAAVAQALKLREMRDILETINRKLSRKRRA